MVYLGATNYLAEKDSCGNPYHHPTVISRPLLRIRALTKAGAIEPAVATIYAAPASAIMLPPGIAADLAAINDLTIVFY